MGMSSYAQVRIAVNGTHYIKGMAIYGDPNDFPDGVDVIVNSNKSNTKPMLGYDAAGEPNSDLGVLKSMKDNPDNPFGALIREKGQHFYEDPNGIYTDPETGKKCSLSPINQVRREGDWNEWSQGLPSQFLSKQKMPLIKQQLNLAYADKEAEFSDIMSLDNSVVKAHYLKEFGDQCDADAVKLKAASLPGQKWKVLIPENHLKDNECYDPTHENGEQLALVRFPHEGTFQIPIVTVNNNQPEAKKLLKNAQDAIGVNHNVAAKLSGADFDGDTVLAIPVGKNKATAVISSQLKELEGFEPKEAYGTTPRDTGKVNPKTGARIYEYIGKDGNPIKVMTNTQNEMGKVSNLITDMTLKGAPAEDIAKAVRHSMTVIDAEKHHLDYKASERENDIQALKRKYQYRVDEDGKESTGASTLISRAKRQTHPLETQGNPYINPETGEYDWTGESVGRKSKYTGRTYTEEYTTKSGDIRTRTKYATKDSTEMMDHKNAYDLVSDQQTPQELAYADYANKLKSLGNRARKEYISTETYKVNKEAKVEYAEEVKSLNAKLNTAISNAPRERRANIIAYSRAKAIKDANDDMKPSEFKKIKQIEIAKARVEVGASGKNTKIHVTDREWEAIQSKAISANTLSKILDHSDPDELRQRATPKNTKTVSQAQINRIKAMDASGYTIAEIANKLGISTSTVSKNL